MIQVQVQAFGVLKDALGAEPLSLTLFPGATVADLLATVARTHPTAVLSGIAVGVNAEYATSAVLLNDGDEVALLPPVSGGSGEPEIVTSLTRDRIDSERLVAAARNPEDGAIVVFDGIVRNHTRDRRTLYLDYEAYEEMAEKQIAALAGEACARFSVRHVTIVHRLGHLQIGETSVLIVVASAHRSHAYEASRWLIDTLKKQVPIWKKETFADGAVWADGEPFPAHLIAEAEDAS
ncbi:MAG: molybdenum cofactor biosynthesis protein MoaE [Terracidiphilus sp.]|nr:molybdenum cofactor biosynthesis protein MoaE [Terracidiphilus sp.]